MKTFGALLTRYNRWKLQRLIRRELRQALRANRRQDKLAGWLLALLHNMEAGQAPGLLSLLPLRLALLIRAVGGALRKRFPRISQAVACKLCRFKQGALLALARLLPRLM